MGSRTRSSSRRAPLAALALLAALAVCAGAPGGDAAAARFRVCLVTGAPEPFGPVAAAAAAGLEHAVRARGVAARSISAPSAPAFAAALRSCAARGANLTIAAGFPAENAVDAAATAHPDAAFAAIGVDVATLLHRPPNVHGVLFAGEQAGYLAGYAAGLWARAAHAHAVGSVEGLDIPPTERVVAGFEAGAVRADRGLQRIHSWADGFEPALCRGAALDELHAGAAVVLAPEGACGAGVVAASAEKHAPTVVVGSSQGAPPPSALADVELRVDVAVESVIAAALAGRLALGRNATVGAADGAVTLGPWSVRTPAWLRAAVGRQLALLQAGQLPRIPVAVR